MIINVNASNVHAFTEFDNWYSKGNIRPLNLMMKWVSQWAIIYMACLTDSMSTLSKVSTGKLHADRTNASYQSSH